MEDEIKLAFDNAKCNVVRAIPMTVMHEIERRYGGRPASYSCGSCVLRYLQAIIKENNI